MSVRFSSKGWPDSYTAALHETEANPNSFRDKLGRYTARDRHDADLRRKAVTALTAKMARVVHAVIKGGAEYRPFFERPVPGGRTSLCTGREGAQATL
jgi:hypothetical protein